MNKDPNTIKLKQLVLDLENANARLQEALALEPSRINKDATIQRFEFTIELSWKTMQSAARFMGEDAVSPRDAVRLDARMNLISNPESWISLLNARNLTVHVYREDIADNVYEEAKKLPALVTDFLSRLKPKFET